MKISRELEEYISQIECELDKKMLLAILDLGAEIEIVSKKYRVLEINYEGRRKVMVSDRFYFDPISAVRLSINKHLSKIVLGRAEIKVPEGIIARNFKEAKSKIEKKNLKFPLVIKPIKGEESEGVLMNISSLKELKGAFRKSRKYVVSSKEGELVVEEMEKGRNYRILIIDGKVLTCIERIKASVTGDGKRNVKQLIDDFNKKRPVEEYYIKIDKELKKNLKKKKMTLSSVPAYEQRIVLREIASLSTGGDVKGVTSKMNPFFKELAEKAARTIGLTRAGVDLITQDISAEEADPDYTIIEINSNPGVSYKKELKVGNKTINVVRILLESYMKK